MTTKYEIVLSEAELSKALLDSGCVDEITSYDLHIAETAMKATLAKLQPQLDAIGAGGVSGRIMRVVTPTSLVDVDLAIALYQVVEKELLDIEMCFESFDTPQQAINDLIEWHVSANQTPAGYKLVPIDPTPEMLSVAIKKALNAQIGFDYDWRDYTGDLWSAMLSASPTPDIKDSLTTENQELRIVFSGEAPNLTFVDVENEDGFSVNAGQWHKRFDGYTELRIKEAKA